VNANSLWPRPVEKERGGRLKYVLAQIVPCATLREDVFCKKWVSLKKWARGKKWVSLN
jgi:hypothetical protein